MQDCFRWHTQCHGIWYGCTCYKRKLDYSGFFQMSDPMSWHPVHRTFSMNVWCFVIAQLMAIFGWLKIWLAGAFNHGLQPDLLIFQGDFYSCYKKIWLENIFRVFKMSNVSIKRDSENLFIHTTKTERNLERELGFVSVGHSSHPLMIELDWFVFLIKALKQDQECVFLIETVK
jgi:hypothetical protein